MGAPTCDKCLNVCFVWFRVLEPSRENRSDPSVVRWNRPPFGESASPFIDEGDGFTRESVRERVCVLPSLVAHVVGYKVVCRHPQYC